MRSLKLTLAYDGTGFAGWQAQRRGERTVQGVVEKAIGEVVGQAPRIAGAGRTDAGVHAEGQVASVALETRLAPAELARALNARLPPDVVVRALEPAPEGFHARFDARQKVYRYTIWNGRERDPLRARFSHHVRGPLDVGAMARAAAWLLGEHDFAGFQGAGSAVKTTVRRLQRAGVRGVAGHLVVVELEANGFLRHMVRNVVGTLVEVGLERRPEDDLARILASRDRREAGPTAPAQGLCLVRVGYGPAGGPSGDPPAGPDSGFRRQDGELPADGIDADGAKG